MSRTREPGFVPVEHLGDESLRVVQTDGRGFERTPATGQSREIGPLGSVAMSVMLAFIFTIPLESFAIVPGLGNISKVVGGTALVAALMAAATGTKLRRPTTFH